MINPIYKDDDCCCPTCRDFQKEYEKYLEGEKCKEEQQRLEELNVPDNTYGINPYVFDHSRNSVYLTYTGKDKFNWLITNKNKKQKCYGKKNELRKK